VNSPAAAAQRIAPAQRSAAAEQNASCSVQTLIPSVRPNAQTSKRKKSAAGMLQKAQKAKRAAKTKRKKHKNLSENDMGEDIANTDNEEEDDDDEES
jgi:hypothetical protein